MAEVLNVYIARHCLGTAEATRLAAEVSQRLPEIEVKVLMLDEMPVGSVPVPATPAYYLNGRLLFLGNPRLDELMAKIRIALLNKNKGGVYG